MKKVLEEIYGEIKGSIYMMTVFSFVVILYVTLFVIIAFS
jgi:hypothetical protein